MGRITRIGKIGNMPEIYIVIADTDRFGSKKAIAAYENEEEAVVRAEVEKEEHNYYYITVFPIPYYPQTKS